MSYIPIIKTIMASLFKKPTTTAYPFKPMAKDPLVRGGVDIDIAGCIYCGLCVRRCPTGALRTDKTAKEWEIARFKCIVCNACVEACPKKCLYIRPELTAASDALTVDIISG